MLSDAGNVSYGAKSREPRIRGEAGNGRMYDPLTGQFLSPDNYVQTPDFTQSFNRYGYCFNNPLVYTDSDGELAWFIPVIIGALTGFEAGGWISSGTPAPWKWESKDWKAAGVGAMIGAGGGALASSIIGAAGGISGLTGAGWNITSNSLLSSNIGIGSNLLQGRGIDGAFKGGVIGLAAGGLGAWSANIIKGSSIGAKLNSEVINTIEQATTGGIYGFGDRFVRGCEMGYTGGKLWSTALLGMVEGGLSGFYGGTWGEEMSIYGQGLITNSIASLPGMGFSITKYYGYGLVGYGSLYAGISALSVVSSLFANETISAIAGSVALIATVVGSYSLYDPLALKYVKNKFNYYPSVLTVDQIIDTFWRMLFNK